jgi:type VI secretion system secreted protein VgrG
MNGLVTQATRQGRLHTVLGADILNLLRFDGAEHVNDLFAWRVDALALRDDVDFDALLGTHATVLLGTFDLPAVAFDGIVAEAQMLGAAETGWRYELILRPWMWLLSLRRKQQIFHNKTVADILGEVFAPYREAFELRLSGHYPVLEYTVQYRETDLAFATRMMERFGISYHFVHKAGVHILTLTDTISAHDTVPGDTRKLLGVAAAHSADEEHFTAIVPARRITTGAIRLTDYNFKTPTAAMQAGHVAEVHHANGQVESYDYPGDYLAQAAGKRVARLGADRARGQDARHHATGDCASLRAGGRVTLAGDGVPGVGGSLCLTARHQFQSNAYGSGGADSAPVYAGSYVLMPDTAPMRPELKTPRAVVQGPQTAVVVGEGEIDCDAYGRILVQFHWDLDARFSMRCRVSQNWAGKGWGGMVIPRIGMEVVVEFLEGDPDKPLVTGCVYNGKNDVPYPLPEHKTRSTFKTNTHQGTGFNELRFEDAKGEEEVFVHAQKDLTEKVENNASRRVNNNALVSVGGSKLEAVRWNSKDLVGLNYFLNVGGGTTGDVFDGINPEGLRAKAYDLTDDLRNTEAFGNITETCSGNRYNGVAGNQSESIGAAYAVSVGTGMTLRVGQDATHTTGETARFTTSQDHITTVGGKNITLVDGDIVFTNQNGGLVIKENGDILITGKSLRIETSGDTIVTSAQIFLN